MELNTLLKGYRDILNYIYEPRNYYERVKVLLKEYKAPKFRVILSWTDIMALLRSVYRLGIMGRERVYYWKLLFWTSLRKPTLIPLAVTLAISGYHFRKVCELRVH
jgi:hypothetical protein